MDVVACMQCGSAHSAGRRYIAVQHWCVCTQGARAVVCLTWSLPTVANKLRQPASHKLKARACTCEQWLSCKQSKAAQYSCCSVVCLYTSMMRNVLVPCGSSCEKGVLISSIACDVALHSAVP
jgi:hypothetical protein